MGGFTEGFLADCVFIWTCAVYEVHIDSFVTSFLVDVFLGDFTMDGYPDAVAVFEGKGFVYNVFCLLH